MASFIQTGFSKDKPGKLVITHIELGYPVPSTPFYHFTAKLDLPEASIIEVTAYVNGEEMRFVNLHKGHSEEDANYPAIAHRPPSGYALSQDNTIYNNPWISGWLSWQPGEEYKIEIKVRMKETAKQSEEDKIISASTSLSAPRGSHPFDPAWKNYKSIVLSETAGIDRVGEPVEVLLPFYPDEANDLKREIRVVAVDPDNYKLTEVPSQVYDIIKYTEEDDLSAGESGGEPRTIPLWMPTVSCRLSFLAEVPAKSSRVYLVYYNNENALTPSYLSELRVQGEAPGLQIDNGVLTAWLHPNSGHLDQISLTKKPDDPLFHRMETNGAIHWNPGIYVPPSPWTHTADWKLEQGCYFLYFWQK